MFASVATSTMTIRRVQTRGTFAEFVRHAMQAFAAWQQRQSLLSLDDTRLADIGLTRCEAALEAARPMWDVPTNWKR